MTREQFPSVAGFDMTVNKAQDLTIKEGVVIHLPCSGRRFKPALEARFTFRGLDAFGKLRYSWQFLAQHSHHGALMCLENYVSLKKMN